MHGLMAHASWADGLVALAGPLRVLDGIWPYVVILLGFSLIVFVHELGHFSVAKWAGVKVERFAIGFGRELFGFTRGETRYSFNILPLGGYVKMLGQEDFDDKSKELMFNDDPRSFINKPVGHRMAIVSAGVIMNTLFACFLFMIVFMVGMEAMGTRIAYIEPDSPAERAGLLPGDIIREMNGHRTLEFREVQMTVMLAQPHEPLEFVVERAGELKHISLVPKSLIPENSREARRLVVGITPGVTREITVVGPEIDPLREDHPHVGDMLVEIDGVPITDDNVSEVINMLAYANGEVFVERKDPADPDGPPRRVHVNIPPILTIYPQDDAAGSVSVLGLAPLVRADRVGPKGRAYYAGIEVGDTILTWDDVEFPSSADLRRSIRDAAEEDIFFRVRKTDGRIVSGFVRPKRNRRGAPTLQASLEAVAPAEAGDSGDTEAASATPGVAASEGSTERARARFTRVRRFGVAAQAGIETGDVVLRCGGTENPTVARIQRVVETSRGRPVSLTVRKASGRLLTAQVTPTAPGVIDARLGLVAEDLLRTSDIVPTIGGKPSPAALAGMPRGALITAANGQPVKGWRELIDAFRMNAGTSVTLAYLDADDRPHEASFPVPHSLRTLLGVGPEARILSIDGRRTVVSATPRGPEDVAVGYRGGTRTILKQLVGKTGVPVEYRENPLSEIRTAHVDVTADMVEPWLGYIAFSPNIDVAPEPTLLIGENALDAVLIGIHKTYYFILQVYTTMQRMIFSRSIGVENISGPLGIIDVGGKIARAGVIEFIFFMAIISANLAVINFLPLPIVDGGLMVFLIVEKIKGSPISLRVQVATQMIGLFLIIGVFLYVTFNDVVRLFG